MGLLSWLFGKDIERKGSGVWFTGPSKRPELTPELKPYVIKLKAIYGQHRTFNDAAYFKTREIGKEINQLHGYNGMVTVCDTLRFKISAPAARALEYVWDGIGEWQS